MPNLTPNERSYSMGIHDGWLTMTWDGHTAAASLTAGSTECTTPGPYGTRVLTGEPHAWQSEKHAGLIWVATCSVCHRVDWAAVNREVRRVQADALHKAADAITRYDAPALLTWEEVAEALHRRADRIEEGTTNA
jgi:hypothetical protein